MLMREKERGRERDREREKEMPREFWKGMSLRTAARAAVHSQKRLLLRNDSDHEREEQDARGNAIGELIISCCRDHSVPFCHRRLHRRRELSLLCRPPLANLFLQTLHGVTTRACCVELIPRKRLGESDLTRSKRGTERQVTW